MILQNFSLVTVILVQSSILFGLLSIPLVKRDLRRHRESALASKSDLGMNKQKSDPRESKKKSEQSQKVIRIMLGQVHGSEKMVKGPEKQVKKSEKQVRDSKKQTKDH